MARSEEEAAAGAELSRTALRDFGTPQVPQDQDGTRCHLYRFDPADAPVPALLRYALNLIGLDHHGPAEKLAWVVPFNYKGQYCELSHEKFGVRLRIYTQLTASPPSDPSAEIRSKLLSAVGAVERLLGNTASEILDAGDVTVLNQHAYLRRAYDYFRERASNPATVEDIHETGEAHYGTWSRFVWGRGVMATNASHDLVAAITAFLSSLEHDFVLALPFLDFDPATDRLTQIIGAKWGDKWRRVVGDSDARGQRLRQQLTAVVERWRNPYSHGGFEKGHGATLYLHTPGLGALPIGLSRIRDSPILSFHPASETDIEGVFALFDEIDAYMLMRFPDAMSWIDSGLPIRFDADFRAEVAAAAERGATDRLLAIYSDRQEVIDNMDF